MWIVFKITRKGSLGVLIDGGTKAVDNWTVVDIWTGNFFLEAGQSLQQFGS
jgi:hypothetical protein